MNSKSNREVSIAEDNFVAETVYDHDSKETSFAVYDGSQIEYRQFVEVNDKKVYPLDEESEYISNKVVRLPSEASEYDSQKELVEGIQDFIHGYLGISDSFESIAAYFVLLTWAHDKFNEVPYLRAIGDWGSGKSRFVKAIGHLCYKPITTTGATTTSPIFRILNGVGGTLMLDESDFQYSDKTSDLIKILNNGYTRGMPVLRSEGRGVFEVKSFDVFGPKIIATRDKFDDQALESRMLVEQMSQHNFRDDIPLSLDKEFYKEARNIRNKLLTWRLRNYFEPLPEKVEIDIDVQPRLKQITQPLLRIIDSEEARENLKDFIIDYDNQLAADRRQSWEGEALEALLRCMSDDDDEPTVKAVTEIFNTDRDEFDEIKSRKMGWIIREKLKLSTTRNSSGKYYVPVSEHEERIEILKDRYGIDMNVMNIMNVEEDNGNEDGDNEFDEITKEDMPFP